MLDNKVKKDAFCLKVVHRNETSELNAFWTQTTYASDFAFTGKMEAMTLERFYAFLKLRKEGRKKRKKKGVKTHECKDAWTQKRKILCPEPG